MTEHPCEHQTTGTTCGHPTSRRYLTGWKCPTHTPAALAGRQETTPDPTRTLQARIAQHQTGTRP